MPDHRDLVIDMLADDEAALREQCRAYREIAVAAFHALHQLTGRINRQHESICSLRKALRERMRITRSEPLKGRKKDYDDDAHLHP